MKKLVFTAIAVIAFSGIGMANTKEVKLVSSVEDTKKAEVEDLSKCAQLYLDVYDFLSYNGYSDKQAAAGAWAKYSSCVDRQASIN